jgi:hypothetical protein
MEMNASKVDIAIKALAVFGLASLLGLGIAGVVRMSESSDSNTFSSLASLFSFRREAIVMSVSPTSIKNGDSFTVHWTHEGRDTPGIYIFSYPCENGLEFLLPSGMVISCGASYHAGDVDSLTLSAKYSGVSPVNVQLSVQSLGNDSKQIGVIGSAVLLVTPTPGVSNTPPPSPSISSPSPAQKPVSPPATKPGSVKTTITKIGTSTPPILPNGTPDLAVRIVDVGIINASGVFVATSSVFRTQQAAVVFDIMNNGTAVSKQWDFTAILPIAVDGYYHSEAQQPLSPGDRFRFTLGFTDLNAIGENKFVMTVDPANSLKDSNRSNDSATATIFRID